MGCIPVAADRNRLGSDWTPFARIDGTGMNAHGRHFQRGSEMVRAAIIADEERRAGKQCRQLRQFAAAHKRSYRGGVGDLIDNALGNFDFVRPPIRTISTS